VTNIDQNDYLYTLNDITLDLMDYDTFSVDIKRDIVKNRYGSNRSFRCITCTIKRKGELPKFTLKMSKEPLVQTLDRMKEFMDAEGFDCDYVVKDSVYRNAIGTVVDDKFMSIKNSRDGEEPSPRPNPWSIISEITIRFYPRKEKK